MRALNDRIKGSEWIAFPENPMKVVTAHDTTVEIDSARNRFVMRSPDGSHRTYPFVPMGTLVTHAQMRLAAEGLSQDQARLMSEWQNGPRSSGLGYGMVKDATILAPGVAYGISEVVGGFYTRHYYWILRGITVLEVPTEGGDGYSGGTPILPPSGLLAVSRDGKRFLSRAHDGFVVVHLDEGHVLRIATHRTEEGCFASVSSDGKRFLIRAHDGFVVVHLDEGHVLRIATHRTDEGHFASDPDLRVLVTTVADGTVLVSDTTTGACIAETRVQDRRLRNVTLSDDGEQVAFRGVQQSWVWHWRSEPTAALADPAATVRSEDV